MKDINSVVLIGRLTQNAKTAKVDNGNQIRFTLAVNSSKKGQNKWIDVANFFNVDYFSTNGNIVNYLLKGAHISVKGELEQKRWTDKRTNEPKQLVGVKAKEIEFLDSKTR